MRTTRVYNCAIIICFKNETESLKSYEKGLFQKSSWQKLKNGKYKFEYTATVIYRSETAHLF